MDMLANFNHRSARLRRGIVPAMAAIFISGGTVAVFSADTNPPPAKVALVIPRSVFVDDLTKGKDPFFPGTSRRLDKTAAVIAGPGSATEPAKPVAEQVQLKGILNSTNRRLALINNHTFEAGEQADVKTSGGKVRVRCVEIRPRSVVILLAGESQRRELHLHDKL